MCWDTGLAAAYCKVSAHTWGLCLEGYALVLLGLAYIFSDHYCSLLSALHSVWQRFLTCLFATSSNSFCLFAANAYAIMSIKPVWSFISCCASLLFGCCDKTLIQNNSRTERFIWPTDYSHHRGKSGQRFKARTWKQELKQRPWRTAACWLSPYNMLSLLYSTNRTTCQGGTVSSLMEAVFHRILLLWRDPITRTTLIKESI